MPEPRPSTETVVLTAEQMSRTITRIAHEILEKNPREEKLAVVGIHTRGAFLGERIHKLLCDVGGREYADGNLDISFYRDDVATRLNPEVHRTDIPFAVEGRDIVLCDDVLFTGRTIRAAMDAVMDYGRPCSIQLAVLVDRGHRELPIRADYVGKNVPTSRKERVTVAFGDTDGREAVEIYEVAGEGDE